MTITKDKAIEKFRELFQGVSCDTSLDAKNEIKKIVSFYKDFRITGASPEDDGDMLLFEWGETSPHVMDEFTDFTQELENKKEVEFHPDKYKWIGLTRQIHVTDDEGVEFDGNAIGLCLYFYFKLSDENDQSGDEWIYEPNETDEKVNELLNSLYINTLTSETPSKTNAFISGIG